MTQVQELNLWDQFLVKEKNTDIMRLDSTQSLHLVLGVIGLFLLTTDFPAGCPCRVTDVTPPIAYPAAHLKGHTGTH
jgi:hypothetical protein